MSSLLGLGREEVSNAGCTHSRGPGLLLIQKESRLSGLAAAAPLLSQDCSGKSFALWGKVTRQ